ncbi:MAG: FAD binding domain-containing protein [Tissierellia bacterium]|nr:FAD binding domain-containing protein [Tissierellia bacterium]
MFQLKEFVQPKSLEEAYKIYLKSRKNVILGGTTFLRLSENIFYTGIDLSFLNLNQLIEREDEYELGAYVTYGDIERCKALSHFANGILPKAISNIIGTQFRNHVTVGASVYSRYGFSDFLPPLLVLNTDVELYQGGRIPLEEFLTKPIERDILTKIYIKKEAIQARYESYRQSSADFPLVNVAISKKDGLYKVAFGARPQRAILAENVSHTLNTYGFSKEQWEKIEHVVKEEDLFKKNDRGSKEYREKLAINLLKRGLCKLEGKDEF